MVRTPEPAPTRFGQVPLKRGLVFTCLNCGRPYAVRRDAALKSWGERGLIGETCQRIRCPQCKRRGMEAVLAPAKAKLGSATELERLLELMDLVKPSGEVS